MRMAIHYSVMSGDKQFAYAGMNRELAEEYCARLNKAADEVRAEMEARDEGLKEPERDRVRFWVKAWR